MKRSKRGRVITFKRNYYRKNNREKKNIQRLIFLLSKY